MDDGYQDGALEKRGDHRAAGPFSGGKYSIYEGGTRTPFIVRWKGTVVPALSDQIVCTIDLLASLAKMVGVPLPKSAARDSVDVLDALIGSGDAKGRDSLVVQDNGTGGNYGLRVGNWKLQRHDSKRTNHRVVEKNLESTPVPRFQLFDLSTDVAETRNVIDQHPDIAEKMKQQLEDFVNR